MHINIGLIINIISIKNALECIFEDEKVAIAVK